MPHLPPCGTPGPWSWSRLCRSPPWKEARYSFPEDRDKGCPDTWIQISSGSAGSLHPLSGKDRNGRLDPVIERSERIIGFIEQHPNASNQEIAKACGVSSGFHEDGGGTWSLRSPNSNSGSSLRFIESGGLATLPMASYVNNTGNGVCPALVIQF